MSKRYPGGIIRKTPPTPSQTSAQGIWDMASVTQAVKENTWPIAGVPDPISKSLRFRSSASAYLNRTPASAGNRKTWTFSAWVKRGALSGNNTIFNAGYSTVPWFILAFASDNTLAISATAGSSASWKTAAVFRDPSAWYHVVCVVDTTSSTSTITNTSTDRIRLYVNGVQYALSGGTVPTQNSDLQVNNTIAHTVGGYSTEYFDGYMTEVYLIDGQALTPSSFGSTNDQTGVWQPIAYTGTYGTNGFYLPFSNTASTTTLGYDFSGNSNNWTTNNISLTSGSTYDSMVDVPTQWIPYNTAGDTGALFRGNYATWNPITVGTATVTNGNLTSTGAASTGNLSSILIPSSGKWYAEFTWSGSGAGTPDIGIFSADVAITATSARCQYRSDGSKVVDATVTGGYGATYTNGDVIAVAVDVDSSTVTFYKNNASQGAITYTSSNGRYAFNVIAPNSSWVLNANFGQRPFSYTPPSGFKTLCTTNLSTPTIGATASTTANKYFDATLYTGNSSTQVVTNSGSMQPDFLWMKARSAAYNHGLQDAIRGAGNTLYSNLTNAADTQTSITSFNSNGFTLANDSWNQSGVTYVGWQWRASNATAVTNTAGSITSTVSANTTAGFSIVTYTGSGAAGTVGHGLGVAPAMIITKNRTTAGNSWVVWHKGLSGAYSSTTGYIYLDQTAAAGTTTNFYDGTAMTSTTFRWQGGNINVNSTSNNYVSYCFSEVAGYSAFGSYTGNGSADGPFIYIGFRPRFVMIKRTDSADSWLMNDTSRSNYNGVNYWLQAESSVAESTNSPYQTIYLSNGFKLTGTSSSDNASGGTYIYMAFAESPFKYALAR